jgi:hypothetical protein
MAWGVILALVITGSAPTLARAQSDRQPAPNSPLNRTNTRLKPKPAKPTNTAPKAPKPLGTLKPVGRTNTNKQPPIKVPVEGFRRVVFGENSIQEQVRSNSGGDIDLDLDGATAQVSEVFTRDGFPSPDKAIRNIAEARREGKTASSNQELQQMVKGDQRDLAAARADYLARGFREVHMNDNEVVFVKSDDPAAAADVATMLEDRVSDRMYRAWMDEWERSVSERHQWVYDAGSGGGCRSCAGGACSSTPVIDAFILRGTLNPMRELSDNELAELEMSDAERAENALLQGDYPLAIDRYESCLKQTPEDAASMRCLAVALLNSNRVPDSLSKFGEAYRLDPTLAGQPMSLDYFKDGSESISSLLQRVVPIANRSKEYDASLAAAVLMQAQGRNKEAARMLEKAVKKGLPQAIEREFEAGAADATPAPGK